LRATPTPSTESGRGSTAGAPAPAPEPGGRRPSPPPNTMPALYGSPAPADLPGATAPLESAEHYNWPPCLAGTPASCSPADAALPALATQAPTPGTLDLRRKDGMNDTSTAPPAPESLRDRMVDRVQAAGWARRRGVEQAMRTVPRHRYVPAAPIEDAYDEQAVITKRA